MNYESRRMNCSEARKHINQGLTPGSLTPLRAALGFHLAHCPECRTYFEQNQTLLNNLLLKARIAQAQHEAMQPPRRDTGAPLQPHAPLPPSSTARPPGAGRRTTQPDVGGFLWRVNVLLLVLFPLVGLLWLGSIVIHTQQNIAAMMLTPVPLPAGPSAGAQPPTPSPASTPTPATEHPDTAADEAGAAVPPTALPGAATDAEPTPWPTIEVLPNRLPTPVPVHRVPVVNEAMTILLLGQDRRPHETDISRTDAIMLVRIDPLNKRIALLSLPRDLWVEIPGFGYDRVNMAYRWGELYDMPGGGLGIAARTVSILLGGLRIDYVVLADFEGIIGLVDALGGITVDVENELYDPNFPTMDYGYTVAHFLPGPQRMDGTAALTYSRIRHPDSDFMRIRRQQVVFTAIGERLRERGDLYNVLTIDQTTAALRDYIRTDLPQEQIVGLIWAFRDYDTAHVERYSVSGEMVSMGIGSDLYALVPSYEALAHLTNLFLGAQ